MDVDIWAHIWLRNTGMCVRFVICSGWHLNDLSNSIKIDTVNPLDNWAVLCIAWKLLFFNLPFLHLFILKDYLLRSFSGLVLMFPSNRHAAPQTGTWHIISTGCCNSFKTFKIMNTEDREIQQKPTLGSSVR